MANPACGICGKPMVRFENPVRYICTRTADHARIEREKRQRSGNLKGNPQTPETLRKGKKKKK